MLKKLILAFSLLCGIAVAGRAQDSPGAPLDPPRKKAIVNIRQPPIWPTLFQSNPPLTIRESDGVPSVTNATRLVFPNGSLVRSGSTITYLGGGSTSAPQTITSNSASCFVVGPNGATNPVFQVVCNVASQATGLSVTGRAAGAGVDLTVLTSGTNENVRIVPAGSGTVFIGGSSPAISTESGNLRLSSNTGNIGLSGTDAVGIAATTHIGVASNADIRFTNASGDYTATADVGFARKVAGVVGITDASTGGGTYSAPARTAAQITADQNNYNPGGSSYFQRWSSDAARNVTGLTFTATQVDGQSHMICNVGAQNIVLVNESASSTAANRFTNTTGANHTLGANNCAVVVYDNTSQRWRASKLP